jgi:hypothetical protein
LDINQQKKNDSNALERKSASVNIFDTNLLLYNDDCFFGRHSHQAQASYWYGEMRKYRWNVGKQGIGES